MTLDEAAEEEFRRIHQACEDLGADEEMTALVLASYRNHRTVLDLRAADGGDLLAYVRHKLAIWEAIFADSPDDPTFPPWHSDHEQRPRMHEVGENLARDEQEFPL
jgi:hypothetical protein